MLVYAEVGREEGRVVKEREEKRTENPKAV